MELGLNDDVRTDVAHRVTFFGPTRPVAGGTIYIRSDNSVDDVDESRDEREDARES